MRYPSILLLSELCVFVVSTNRRRMNHFADIQYTPHSQIVFVTWAKELMCRTNIHTLPTLPGQQLHRTSYDKCYINAPNTHPALPWPAVMWIIFTHTHTCRACVTNKQNCCVLNTASQSTKPMRYKPRTWVRAHTKIWLSYTGCGLKYLKSIKIRSCYINCTI